MRDTLIFGNHIVNWAMMNNALERLEGDIHDAFLNMPPRPTSNTCAQLHDAPGVLVVAYVWRHYNLGSPVYKFNHAMIVGSGYDYTQVFLEATGGGVVLPARRGEELLAKYMWYSLPPAVGDLWPATG